MQSWVLSNEVRVLKKCAMEPKLHKKRAGGEKVNGQEALIRMKNWHRGIHWMRDQKAGKLSDSRILELATLEVEQFLVCSIVSPVSGCPRWNGGIITGSDGMMEPRDWYIGRAICIDARLTHNLGRLGVKRKDRSHRQKASVKWVEYPKVYLITSLKS